MTNLKDVIHLYIGCDCEADMTDRNMGKHIVELQGIDKKINTTFYSLVRNGVRQVYGATTIKPFLRPMKTFNADDFYSFFDNVYTLDKFVLLKATINNMYCGGWYSNNERLERIDNELPADDVSLLYDIEEHDHTDIISCDKNGSIAYGLSDEMRFFPDVDLQAKWILHLAKRKLDLFNLIESDQAIKLIQ